MPAPATTGQLRTRIEDMQIGDYIICGFDNAVLGGGWNINDTSIGEIPLTGKAWGTPNKLGYFYFIKVTKGLLVADRILFNSCSWDNLNYYGSDQTRWMQGRTVTIGGITGIIRSLTGGVAYADQYGNKSLTDQGYGGWPNNNEWDKYIVNFPQELIQSGKTLDDVFHWNGVGTWCQDTPINGVQHPNTSSDVGQNTKRTWRGYGLFTGNSHINARNERMFGFSPSNYIGTTLGFRPVFEYIES